MYGGAIGEEASGEDTRSLRSHAEELKQSDIGSTYVSILYVTIRSLDIRNKHERMSPRSSLSVIVIGNNAVCGIRMDFWKGLRA